jgi:hypothetical protein
MSLDDLIARLTSLRSQANRPDQAGRYEVVVTCPIAELQCWTNESLVQVVN